MSLSDQQFGDVFHAETMRSSGDFLRATNYVHVGSKRAALARVHPENWEDAGPEYGQQGHDFAAGKSRIWQGRIDPAARIGPALTDDQANDMHIQAGNREARSAPYDVYPYRNEYEDPGSTSYLVHPRALQRLRPIATGPGRIKAAIQGEGP